jgi:lysophospholipase L1-like esterase
MYSPAFDALLVGALALSLLANAGGFAIALRVIRRRGGWTFVRSWLVARGVMRDEAKERFEGALASHKRGLYAQLSLGPTDIVMLGDSITEGGEWAELLGDARVKNRGVAGDSTEGLLTRLGPVFAGHPAQVFVMAGVNDMLSGASVETVAGHLERLLEVFSAATPGTRVMLQRVLPIDPTMLGTGDNGAIRALNDRLRALAAAHGATYVDLYPRFEVDGRLEPGLSHDGLHLDGPGYVRWREAIAPLLV